MSGRTLTSSGLGGYGMNERMDECKNEWLGLAARLTMMTINGVQCDKKNIKLNPDARKPGQKTTQPPM